MNPPLDSWHLFDAQAPVLTYEYSFGPGTARALAVAGKDGLVVLSPPCGSGTAMYDELLRFGPVKALVAPNAFHHLGLAQWQARFPQAGVFAPAQALARLRRRCPALTVRPLSDATALFGDHLTVTDMPHYKLGEALVRVATSRGLVWYVTDVVVNLPALPDHPVARLLFKLSRSAPGLRFNNLAGWVMVRDKRVLKRWLAGELAASPPAWLIPSHGDLVDLGAGVDPLRRVFDTA